MMKKLFLLIAAGIFWTAMPAQTNVPAETSDPEAKKVLDRIRKKYEGYKSMEAAFSLTIEVPQQALEVQKGAIGQQGNKFRLEMDQQMIVSDGKTNWVYLKQNNEVQISDAQPGGAGGNDFLSPADLMKQYQKGEYLYAITDKVTEKGVVITQIEFKPKSKASEYSKLRVSVNEKAGTIQSIKAFAKDGSRYTFQITRFTPNKAFAQNHFSFDPKQVPGIHIEDLREK